MSKEDRFMFRIWRPRGAGKDGWMDYNCEADAYACYVGSGWAYEFHPGGMTGYESLEVEPLRDDCVIMQCTGLRARNEALVYEGDVLGWDDGTRCVVCWDLTCWTVHDVRDWKAPPERAGADLFNCALDLAESAQVLGNVYEHPELVQKEAGDGR